VKNSYSNPPNPIAGLRGCLLVSGKEKEKGQGRRYGAGQEARGRAGGKGEVK